MIFTKEERDKIRSCKEGDLGSLLCSEVDFRHVCLAAKQIAEKEAEENQESMPVQTWQKPERPW